jgi:tetrahydromethanopterin S-methyltransferase subunit B
MLRLPNGDAIMMLWRKTLFAQRLVIMSKEQSDAVSMMGSIVDKLKASSNEYLTSVGKSAYLIYGVEGRRSRKDTGMTTTAYYAMVLSLTLIAEVAIVLTKKQALEKAA